MHASNEVHASDEVHASIATAIRSPGTAPARAAGRLPCSLPVGGPRSSLGLWLAMFDSRQLGLALVGLAFVVYAVSHPVRSEFYDHFVWQADAWLHGRLAIP